MLISGALVRILCTGSRCQYPSFARSKLWFLPHFRAVSPVRGSPQSGHCQGANGSGFIGVILNGCGGTAVGGHILFKVGELLLGRAAADQHQAERLPPPRRAFLNAGYYGIFGRALGELCLAYGVPTGADAPLHLLDAGCGEGWYDRCIAQAFAQAGRPVQLAGFDIAKPAVRLAAKALPAAKYAVASSFAQPVRTGWADLLLNCLSPFAQEEFRRVLRPGGRMIYVVPGAEHLYQMKAVLYDTPYKNPVQEVAYEGFRPIGEREVSGRITVPAGQLEALFAMTPYYWKTPRDGAARLAALPELTTDIAFRFLVFEKE